MTTEYAILCCILGAAAFLICSSKTLKERVAAVGYAAFWVGLLVWMLAVGHTPISWGR